MTRVLVTGGTGFVGQHLSAHLWASGYDVVLASRQRPANAAQGEASWIRFDLGMPESLPPDSLRGVDCVFHLAAKVHVMKASHDDEESFGALNTKASEVLAMRAAEAGVRRFVFLSSIKVNGERTLGRPFSPSDVPAPQDAYARSKWRAEEALAKVARSTQLEVAVVRPPLVYGPGVGANFRRLLQLAASGWPLPLAGIDNRRSLVNVWNLVDLLAKVSASSHAPGRTWLVSDDEDVPTSKLIGLMANALGAPKRTFGVPASILKLAARALGRTTEVTRMIDSLQLDIVQTKERLGWTPPVPLTEGIARTALWFLETERSK